MADINRRLLEHPAAQRKPETNDEWLNFIKVLVQYTGNPDAIDVAIEGGASLANALPNASRNTSAVKELQTWVAQDDASDENRREVPTDEIQFENSSINGEVLTGGNVGTGHVPAVSTTDTNINLFGAGAYQAYDRGLLWWDEAVNSLKLRTDAPGNELELGKQVAFRVINVGATPIVKGDFIASAGAISGIMTVKAAYAGENANGIFQGYVVGIAAGPMGAFDLGYAIAFGALSGIKTDTDAAVISTTDGRAIYLSETVPGGWVVDPPKRRVKLGYIANKNASNGSLAIQIANEDHLTFTGVSFNITGTGGVGNPTINKEFNVTSIVHQGALGSGTYRVTLVHMYFNLFSGTKPYTEILTDMDECWTVKSTTAGTYGPVEKRVYITVIDPVTTFKTGPAYFDFTVYDSVSGGVGVLNSLQPVDLAATDDVTFFGQMMPY